MTRDQAVGIGVVWFVIAMILVTLIWILIDHILESKKVLKNISAVLEEHEEYKAVCPCGWESEFFQDIDQANEELVGHISDHSS